MTDDADADCDTEQRPRTVLLADDDHDIRALLAAALRREGYLVIEAKDGADVLDQIGDALLFDAPMRPDIIVSDQRMPGFVGTSILSGLRGSDWRTPFILITAYGGPELEREARLLGADAVFKKPFDVEQLLATVALLVGLNGPTPLRA